MTTQKKVLPILLSVSIATTVGLAVAQTPATGPEQSAPPPATATAPAPVSTTPTTPAASAKRMLGLNEIEAILQKAGIKVHELEVRDAVVEAEGHDANQREVELVVDRRSGEILSRRFDD
jgi:hypothetical protein